MGHGSSNSGPWNDTRIRSKKGDHLKADDELLSRTCDRVVLRTHRNKREKLVCCSVKINTEVKSSSFSLVQWFMTRNDATHTDVREPGRSWPETRRNVLVEGRGCKWGHLPRYRIKTGNKQQVTSSLCSIWKFNTLQMQVPAGSWRAYRSIKLLWNPPGTWESPRTFRKSGRVRGDLCLGVLAVPPSACSFVRGQAVWLRCRNGQINRCNMHREQTQARVNTNFTSDKRGISNRWGDEEFCE